MRRIFRKRRWSRDEVMSLTARAQWDFLEKIAHDNGGGRWTWRKAYWIDLKDAHDAVRTVNERLRKEM